MDRAQVMARVEDTFAGTSRGLSPWPDPRPDGRSPREEEYSRLLDPEKYRLLSARFEAWAEVLTAEGWCRRFPDTQVEWVASPGVLVTRTELLDPVHAGVLPLAAIHSRIDTCDEAGLVLGVGTPAREVASLPGCGCDACDDGSEPLLEELDEVLWALVSGTFLEVRDGDRWARTFGGGRGAAQDLAAGEFHAWIADPGDRTVITGSAWDAG